MCVIDDVKDVIVEYKIYDYEGDRQVWNKYEDRLHRIENDKLLYDNEYEKENEVVDFKNEEEYWENEIKEWSNILN